MPEPAIVSARCVGKRELVIQIFLFIFLMLSAATAHAAEQPLLVSKSYWVDEGANATLGEAMDAAFSPFEVSITKGYTTSALWLRLRVSGQNSRQQLALIVDPAFLCRIEFYDPTFHRGAGPLKPRVSGRDAPLGPGTSLGLKNGFILTATELPRDVFLRVTTNTSLTVSVELLSLDEADHHSHVTAGALAVYASFLLAFCLWGVVTWAIRREAIYGLFAFRQFYTLAHSFMFFGAFRYFFSDDLSASARDFIYGFVVVTIIAVAGYFDMRLISEFGASRRIGQILRAALLLPAISLALLFLGHTQAALSINATIVNLVLLLIVVFAFSTRPIKNQPYERLAVLTVRFGFLLMTLVVVVPVLMYQNLINASVPLFKLLFLHSVISTIVLFAILSIRSRQRDLQAQQTLLENQLEIRELAREKERRIDKERFLSMLTHELRNPLSVIRLMTQPDSSEGKAVQKAALEMARVIERVEQSEKLESEALEISKVDIDLKRLLGETLRDHHAAARVDINVPDRLTLAVDVALLQSILGNLLDNAAKYSRAGSRIRIDVGKGIMEGRDGVSLAVINEAGDAGVPDASKLFTKYYRSKGAHRLPGSGLGMYLVASWVKALGGRISCEPDTHPDGAQFVTFRLWLPQ